MAVSAAGQLCQQSGLCEATHFCSYTATLCSKVIKCDIGSRQGHYAGIGPCQGGKRRLPARWVTRHCGLGSMSPAPLAAQQDVSCGATEKHQQHVGSSSALSGDIEPSPQWRVTQRAGSRLLPPLGDLCRQSEPRTRRPNKLSPRTTSLMAQRARSYRSGRLRIDHCDVTIDLLQTLPSLFRT